MTMSGSKASTFMSENRCTDGLVRRFEHGIAGRWFFGKQLNFRRSANDQ